MRRQDLQLAIEMRARWHGKGPSRPPRSTLLANLDEFLAYLDSTDIRPGDAIGCCPACGEDHRWVLIKELLILALEVPPRRSSPLLEWADHSLDEVRELYGGEEGYRKMREAAEAYFKKIGANKVYTP